MVPLAIAETSSSTRSLVVKSRLCSQLTDMWGWLTRGVPLSASLSPLFDLGFELFFKNHISGSGDPKFVKSILRYSLRWLVFNKNIK